MIVLDTNVVSEAMRPEPDSAVMNWLNAQEANTLYLSSVTLAELLFGIGVLPDGRRKAGLVQALDRLMGLFSGRVLPFDQTAAQRYGEIAVVARSVGRPLPAVDGYLAATAAASGYALATRNIRHFIDTGVELINPWQEH
ncbi:MAG: type II toxin-antitoxin system VapC family toxin [Microthrixaceae bacterium]|nr:type II toxin-antitoxin system VapC family toxin [Microthrixaceae bacterium]